MLNNKTLTLLVRICMKKSSYIVELEIPALINWAFIDSIVFTWVENNELPSSSGRKVYHKEKDTTIPKNRNMKKSNALLWAFSRLNSPCITKSLLSSYFIVLYIKGIVANTVRNTTIKLD